MYTDATVTYLQEPNRRQKINVMKVSHFLHKCIKVDTKSCQLPSPIVINNSFLLHKQAITVQLNEHVKQNSLTVNNVEVIVIVSEISNDSDTI